MLTEKQLLWRRGGIGSSDAKKILSADPDVWEALRNEKLTGETDRVSKQTQMFFNLGNAIERVCLDYFNDNVAAVELRNVAIESALDPFFRATLDGMTPEGLIVEAKSHFMDKTTEELVEFYWPQLQHQLFVTQTQELHFAVIFGHYARFDHEVVKRDEAFIEGYQIKAYQFRDYLETGKLPADLDRPVPVTIVRKRKHEWPTNDNEIADLAVTWLTSYEAVDKAKNAEKDLKAKVPDDCVEASWRRSDGSGIVIKVSKGGAKSLRAVPAAA
jgi:hypothetical protein